MNLEVQSQLGFPTPSATCWMLHQHPFAQYSALAENAKRRKLNHNKHQRQYKTQKENISLNTTVLTKIQLKTSKSRESQPKENLAITKHNYYELKEVLQFCL